jgi:two-component system CheB/CheR fusion protein
MIFVVVQHLDPNKKSALVDILGNDTDMPVHEVIEGVRILENNVYVIPPSADLSLVDGHLHLAARTMDGGRHMSVDTFFETLGRTRKTKAIGIILSGSGNDGAAGLQVIKDEGGITFAQSDRSSKFAAMPLAAAATGCVDFVADPKGIAEQLIELSKHPFLTARLSGSAQSQTMSGFEEIIDILVRQFGVEFNHYKQSTLRRRVLRRMVFQRMKQPKDYATFLRNNVPEMKMLYDDLLINVTEFFRDPDVFDFIRDELIPSIIKGRRPQDAIRIWVPGCSTGEEVYSILILLLEALDAERVTNTIQVFATDISERALNKARIGVYQDTQLRNVSPERLANFFYKTDAGFKICKRIRDLCVFSIHNVTSDPPFSNLDLISCRNLLIYLDSELQKKAFPIFHYALKPESTLVLGTAESIGEFSNLFSARDSKRKIFIKRQTPSTLFALAKTPRSLTPVNPVETRVEKSFDLLKEAQRQMLSIYAPSGVVTNGDFDILHTVGDTGKFLALAPGTASLNLLKMVHGELEIELRGVLLKASKSSFPARSNITSFNSDGEARNVRIQALPIRTPASNEQFFLIVFDEVRGMPVISTTSKSKSKAKKTDTAIQSEIDSLKQQLASAHESLTSARQTLKATIEIQESVIEELRSANEEIVSGNEELQSSNEELETAKEELQSTNEELHTVNAELQHGNAELTKLNDDLTNILTNSPLCLVIVSNKLELGRFTPAAGKLFRLGANDIDRPLSDVSMGLEILDLEDLIRSVTETLSPIEREVQDRRGKWYLLQIRPYRTLDNRIDGAVIVLVDIDAIRRSREAANAIVATVREPLVVLDKHLRVVNASRSFYTTFQTTPNNTIGKDFHELDRTDWDNPALRSLLGAVLEGGKDFTDFEVTKKFARIGFKTMLLNARRIEGVGGEPDLILLAIEDISERRAQESEIVKTSADLKRTNTQLEQFAYIASHDLQEPLRTMSIYIDLIYKQFKGVDPSADEFFDIALSGVGRMKQLVADILDFAQATRAEVKFEPVDCEMLVARIERTLKTAITNAGAELHYQSLPTVLSSDILLGQIFQNLISNCLKFRSPNVAPEITIEARERATDWLFSVSDNGIGIEKKYATRIFQIFQRLHNAKDYPGTGIGLSMCQNIVERYGGTIWVESELGKGSQFFFTLPKPAANA